MDLNELSHSNHHHDVNQNIPRVPSHMDFKEVTPFNRDSSQNPQARRSDQPRFLPPEDEYYDAPENATAMPTVVNNYSNCSFGAGTQESLHRKRTRIPVFDDSKLDVEAYLANFKAVTKDWTKDEKLTALREKLEGRAAKVLASLDLQGKVVTFDVLVLALEQNYIGEKSLWMTKLRDARREDGESIDDLAFRLSLYSKRAYGALQPDLGVQFYLALRDSPLGDKLHAYKDQPLDEILKQAISYENHLLSTNQLVLSPSPSQSSVAALDNDQHGHDGQTTPSVRGGFQGRGRGYDAPGGVDDITNRTGALLLMSLDTATSVRHRIISGRSVHM
jgi:hypothetical protein